MTALSPHLHFFLSLFLLLLSTPIEPVPAAISPRRAVLCSCSDFPQDSSMLHYQVKSGGAAEIHRGAMLRVQTHTGIRAAEDRFSQVHSLAKHLRLTGVAEQT